VYKDEGGHSTAEWLENEHFWVDLYPFLFPEKRFQAAVEEIEKIVALTGFQGNTVLDLCCGPTSPKSNSLAVWMGKSMDCLRSA
jgi:hypothetical protein